MESLQQGLCPHRRQRPQGQEGDSSIQHPQVLSSQVSVRTACPAPGPASPPAL